MFIKENILLAVASLKANKMRALLTMLGIIIGISSVIAIVSVGNAVTSSVTGTMSSMGANNITVNVSQKTDSQKEMAFGMQGSGNNRNGQNNRNGMPGGGMPGAGMMAGGGMPGGGMPGGGMPGGGSQRGRSGGASQTKSPTDDDLLSMDKINAMIDNFKDEIDCVSISESKGSGKAKDGTLYANVTVTGTNDSYQNVKNITITEGRYISQNDVNSEKKVAVVSDKLVNNMFGKDVDPIGKEVVIYESNSIVTYTIIGVYKYESNGSTGTTTEADLTTNLYVPITTVKTALHRNYQNITVKPKESVSTQTLTDELTTYFTKIYAKNTYWTATASNMESMLSNMTSMMSTIAMALSAIAGISLVVGGIGVMNIMLVSVTERTREIGTRKALGAKNLHIQVQFIVESMIICAIGGLIGIVCGMIFGSIGAHLLGKTPSVSIPVMIISFTFSMVIGVFFGYYPAKKAANLDPIEALRYE